MNELALFAGAGGGILGGHLLGWRTVCAVEWDSYAASILVARQNDKTLPPFPIWDDVQTFDGRPWRGRVDIVSGGFPCQDISVAGKGAGIDGERSGMWNHMARVIREVRPRFVFVENSPALTFRGMGTVLGDLAEIGYDAEWGVLGADDVGAPHRRKRIWILAYAPEQYWPIDRQKTSQFRRSGEVMADADNLRKLQSKRSEQEKRGRISDGGTNVSYASKGRLQVAKHESRGKEQIKTTSSIRTFIANQGWWKTEPNLGRVVDGVAHRVDRLKCLGNGQVPAVAATAFRILREGVKE